MLQMCERCGWLCPILESTDIDEAKFMFRCRKCGHETPLDKPRKKRMETYAMYKREAINVKGRK